jgi:hypothetical protein
MPRAPKNPDLSRATHLPWDKDGALPIPAGASKARRAGASSRRGDAPEPATADASGRPPAREEYPGPQTASTGEHVEPGDARPSRRRGH